MHRTHMCESDVSCLCPVYLQVASCEAAVGWCCRARVHITCIAIVSCLLNLIVFELDYKLHCFNLVNCLSCFPEHNKCIV